MAAENYTASLKRVLTHEGGYSNHKDDPGGATMRGVIQRVYDGYRDRHGLQRQPVRQISDSEIAAIYRTQYADAIKFDRLPIGIDYVVFDGAVNSGPGQSIKWLQRALGIAADGVIGNVTLAKAEAYPNKAALIDAICDQRMKFLKALKTFSTFGKGWTARVTGVRTAAKQMVRGISPTMPLFDTAPEGAKALATDVDKPAAPVAGPTAGAGAGVVAIALQGAKDALEPLLGTSDLVSNIYAGLTISLAVIAVGGVVYGLYARKRRAEVKDAIGVVT
ncbi:MAG: N-acetylmuramidase [Hyphomicrobiales bacterium]|nr:MAG: N-acetylmuramidase [Hyphomicrobiales bacterium]